VREWAGQKYSLDPTTGITAMFGVQLAPTQDSEIAKVARKDPVRSLEDRGLINF
jgi:hypothetical protein